MERKIMYLQLFTSDANSVIVKYYWDAIRMKKRYWAAIRSLRKKQQGTVIIL